MSSTNTLASPSTQKAGSERPVDYLLSVVAPLYNEQDTVNEMVSRCQAALKKLGCRYELIFVNDGSKDATLPMLLKLKEGDENLRIVNLSRNFGQQLAFTAGLDIARGDAIITLDGDLQDPPEVFPELVEAWKKGGDIVFARRRARAGESALKKLTAALHYRILKEISTIELPVDVGDFRLMDKQALKALNSLRERHRYIRGMVAWIGYKQAFVEFDRDKRFAGTTKYPFLKLMRLAMDGITSFSIAPLRLGVALGVFVLALALLCVLYICAVAVMQQPISGWALALAAVFFVGGLQLCCIGLVGEYIAMLHEASKKRPLYFVDEIY